MKKILLSTLIATLSFPMLSCAASFDCAKAGSAIEKLICSDESISKLDEQLASSYKAALEKAVDKDAFKKTQVEWLKQQRACKDSDCLTKTYQTRIDELTAASAQIVTRPVSPVDVKAENFVTVFKFDSQKGWMVSLGSVPPSEQGIRAILALYSFLNGAGCAGSDYTGTYQCELTKQLGLSQCSAEHIAIVKKWFKKEVPAFSPGLVTDINQTFVPNSLFDNGCYSSPDTSSIQYKWNEIQLSKNENIVTIKSVATWMSHRDTRTFKFVTKFLVDVDSVSVISNTIAELK